MSEVIKSKSPFFPGQPVPEDSFVGRKIEIDKVVHRGIRRVAAGTTDAFFIEGEYGIGKTSVAQYLKALAEKEHHLHAIYVSLGAAHTLEDVAIAVLEATVQSGAFSATRQGTIRHWLSKYIKEVKLFGVALNIPALREDASQVSTISGMLNFLRNVKKQLEGDGVLGVMLILDEINGIASEPKFAHFLKGLIDQNAVDGDPAPFLLLLCGTRERWHALTRSHEPVERIFRLIEIFSLGEKEVQSFFEQSFSSAGLKVDDEALSIITHFSAGYPRLMHLIGDCAYWSNSDDTIDKNDALLAVTQGIVQLYLWLKYKSTN